MERRWLGILGLLLIAAPLYAADAGSAPPFAVAHDAPLEATEKEVGRPDGIIQLRVEFRGIKGDRVPAFLWLPEEKPGTEVRRRPAVLAQYGRGGDKSTDYIVALAKGLAGAGFVALTIDSPYRGERGPEPKDIQFFTSERGKEIFLQYLGDYSRAVDYLVNCKEVDPDRIGYVGASWGAITGLPFVAHEPRVRAMVSLVGGGDFLARSPAAPTETARAVSAVVDPVHHVARIAPRPLLMINVTQDQLIPRASAEAIHRAAGKGSEVVWLETDHYFRGVEPAKTRDLVVGFFHKHLESDRP
jgi:dienelactone hydrolase